MLFDKKGRGGYTEAMTIKAGTPVKSKLTGKTGTMVRMVGTTTGYVRLDGEELVRATDTSRWDEVFVTATEPEYMEDYSEFIWKKGDHIKLTDIHGNVVTGTALDDKFEWGGVFFDFLSDEGHIFRTLNYNGYAHSGGVEILFRASVARGANWE